MSANLRIVEVATGEIKQAKSADIERKVFLNQKINPNKIIIQAQKDLALKLSRLALDEIAPTTIKIAHIDNKTIYFNQGKNNGIKVGNQFKILRLGKPIKDPDTEQILGTEKTEIAIVKIIKVENKMSIAQIISLVDPKKPILIGDTVKKV